MSKRANRKFTPTTLIGLAAWPLAATGQDLPPAVEPFGNCWQVGEKRAFVPLLHSALAAVVSALFS